MMNGIRNRKQMTWLLAGIAALGLFLAFTPAAQAAVEFWIPIRNPDKVYVTSSGSVQSYVSAAVADYDAHTDLKVQMGAGPFFGTTKIKVRDVKRPDVDAYGYTELRTATRTCAALRKVRINGRTYLWSIQLRNRFGNLICDEEDRVSRVNIFVNRSHYPRRQCQAGVGMACMQGLVAHELMHGFGFMGHDCANRILKAPECGHEANRTLSGIDVSDVNARY
jgi:hypothetical protein